MKAIIVVDMQKDFSDFGTIVLKGAIKLSEKISSFLNKINRQDWYFVFSRDWHPYNHMSFKYFNKHCIKNTIGSEYFDELKDIKKDFEVKKGTSRNYDSFSAFYVNKRNKSKLQKWLVKNNIKDVYVCGVLKEICVLQTANDSIDLGFNTYLIEDLSLGLDEQLFEKTINPKVKIINSKELVNK